MSDLGLFLHDIHDYDKDDGMKVVPRFNAAGQLLVDAGETVIATAAITAIALGHNGEHVVFGPGLLKLTDKRAVWTIKEKVGLIRTRYKHRVGQVSHASLAALTFVEDRHGKQLKLFASRGWDAATEPESGTRLITMQLETENIDHAELATKIVMTACDFRSRHVEDITRVFNTGGEVQEDERQALSRLPKMAAGDLAWEPLHGAGESEGAGVNLSLTSVPVFVDAGNYAELEQLVLNDDS